MGTRDYMYIYITYVRASLMKEWHALYGLMDKKYRQVPILFSRHLLYMKCKHIKDVLDKKEGV